MRNANEPALKAKISCRGRDNIRRRITRNDFPINTPIPFEAFIDGNCGWEFDAPLHFLKPFHRYHEVRSTCKETIEAKIQDLMIDVSCDLEIYESANYWPYEEKKYVEGLMSRLRRGKGRRGVAYFSGFLIVKSMPTPEQIAEGRSLDYEITWQQCHLQ